MTKQLLTAFTAALFCVNLLHAQIVPAVPDSERVYTSLSEAAQNPDKVYRLKINRKRLTAFPLEILRFRNLKYLSLGSNRLRWIPGDIGQLRNLEYLDLSKNNITEIPPEIGNLTRLRELILYQNEIDSLPPVIGQLKQLEKLDLWENEISGLPEEMKNLTNLKELDLRGILFTEKQHLQFRELLPGVQIHLSPGCNTCKEP
jgi:Leucine-rich repeat (LRR) protein